jgi:D-psicose/D-tagatose/L-ribulose 3-epimerase
LWTSQFTENHLYLLKKVKKLGCDVVEIPIFNPYAFPTKKVKKELEKNDLDVCICYGCDETSDIASLDPSIRQEGLKKFKKVIDQAYNLGAEKIGGVVYKAGGIFTGSAPNEIEWYNSVESMKEICEYAQNFNISICIEQINRYETYFINTVDDALK